MLVSEENHRVLDGLTNVLELNRVLVEFHSDNLSPTCLLASDPTDLRLHPMDARSRHQGVTPFECLVVVLRIGNCHAGSNGITTSQQSSEIRPIRDP